ncbi:aldehyde ferredoxin oxidoreductase C-terminal domain-containing protein, partial [Chloroflexota bacterium]
LTTGEITTKALDLDIARSFVGDFGINTRLAYDLIKPGVEPLSGDNVIIIGAGPLVGTRVPGAARSHILSKFPLVGSIWEAGGSMALSTRLKAAGYDHLIIRGRASQPVYLRIFNDDVAICDAGDLWGKGVFDATDTLWARHGSRYSVMTIGQAGENLVKISMCLIDKVGTAGKGGLGAVMGAKNLKAVAVNGTGKVRVHDPARFDELTDRLMKRVMSDPSRPEKIRLGQMFEWPGLIRGTKCEYKNWSEIYDPDKAEALFGVEQYLKVKQRRLGCPACPTPDKDALEIKDGAYRGLVTYVAGFAGRARDLGLRCELDSLNELVKCIDLAGQYGIGTHLFWSLTSLAIDLYERGIITRDDTEGLELRRGFETTTKLMEQIAFRRGIGNVLADGLPGIVKRFGKECERYSVTIKGEDVQRDGRANILSPSIFAQIVCPEGGGGSQPGTVASPDHYSVGSLEDAWKVYCKTIGVPDEALPRIFNQLRGYNVGRLTKHSEEWYTIISCLGICMRHHISELYSCALGAELYSALTGIEMKPEELKQASERVWNQLKALNVREGFTRKDDKVPVKWLEERLRGLNGEELPLKDSQGNLVTAATIEKLLDDYYDERGWDLQTGIPTREKLTGLGLEAVIADFKARGIYPA